MNKKVFISGSISIKRLPKEALKSIDKIISKKFEILVGDARGVDSLVQEYCDSRGYHNVRLCKKSKNLIKSCKKWEKEAKY